MTNLYGKDCRIAGGPLTGTGPLVAFETLRLVGIPIDGIRVSPLVFWFHPFTCNSMSAPHRCHHHLSSTTSHAPSDATGTSRLHFLVVRIFSSTPLPGFIGPESSVIPVDLPPSDPYPLRVLLIGIGSLTPIAAFNVRPGGLPWVRRTTSPYTVQLHFGSVHRISGLALPRLLDLLPAAI